MYLFLNHHVIIFLFRFSFRRYYYFSYNLVMYCLITNLSLFFLGDCQRHDFSCNRWFDLFCQFTEDVYLPDTKNFVL